MKYIYFVLRVEPAFFPSFRRQNARCKNADLQNLAFDPVGRAMCLYGDPAYPLRVHLQAPFRVGILTRDMEMFNESMSAVRSSVEWLFGDIVNYFKFLDFKKNLKI